MAEISLVRVDQRMVHGQVAVKWTSFSKATKIICVDDKVAADETMKKIYKLAAPAGVKCLVYSIQRCIEKWNECKFNDGTCMVLFKTVQTAYDTYKAGFPIKKLQLGNVPKVAETITSLGNEVHVTEKELALLKEMAANGVEIEIRTIPEQSATAFKG